MLKPRRPAASPAVASELAAGLLADRASIAPKFFYDELGSRLFEAICVLDEYYPTRTEASIFALHGAEIAHAAGADRTLIDLGAGNCAKAAGLFPLLHPAQYVPVDISADFLRGAVERLRQRFPHIEMTPIGSDFSSALELPATVREEKRLFFYPGSSIGNFGPAEAVGFLRRLRAACGPDGALLIGIDLVKGHADLHAAYDDPLGVTAAFNLNVLRNVNRLLGATFDPLQWKHVAFFNADASRIEMHLEAKVALEVEWEGAARRFLPGECIHTENSYKYTRASAEALLREAGFAPTAVWTDPLGWFAVIHAGVAA